MNNQQKWLLGLGIASLGFFGGVSHADASQAIREWFFGNWNCNIDGRPAQMQWYVVDNPQTTCSGGVCRTTSGVRVVGRFSDNGSGWVPLAKQRSSPTQVNIRYLGNEQDNWYLRYNSSTQSARGWTTWRGNRYPLQCSRG